MDLDGYNSLGLFDYGYGSRPPRKPRRRYRYMRSRRLGSGRKWRPPKREVGAMGEFAWSGLKKGFGGAKAVHAELKDKGKYPSPAKYDSFWQRAKRGFKPKEKLFED